MSHKARKNPDGYIEWHPADFLSSPKVARMSLAEQGAYRRLLDHLYMEGGSISADRRDLADYLGIELEELDDALTPRVSRCFVEEDGRLYNPRASREFRERTGYSTLQSLRAQIRHAKTPEDEARLREELAALQDGCARSAPAVRPQCGGMEAQMHAQETAVPRPDKPSPVQTSPDQTNPGGTGGGPPEPPKRRPRSKVEHWDRLLAPDGDFGWLMASPKAQPLGAWLEHLRERLPKAHTAPGAAQALRRIAEMTDAQFEAAVRHSIEGNYQGLFEPKAMASSNGSDSIFDMVRRGVVQIED